MATTELEVKEITELNDVSITDDTLALAYTETEGVGKATFQNVKKYLGAEITSIDTTESTANGGTNAITINYRNGTDTSTSTLNVKNGEGINTITQTESTDSNGLRSNTIDITASETTNSVSATIKDGVGVKSHSVTTTTDDSGLTTNTLNITYTDGTSDSIPIKAGVGIANHSVTSALDDNGLRSNQVDVTYTDASTDSFTVKDGVGVTSAEQTTESTESGGTNVYTVKLSDGTSNTINIKNGTNAYINSVTATKLDAGATPTVENTGTKQNADLVFGIPSQDLDTEPTKDSANLLSSGSLWTMREYFNHNVPRLVPKDITTYYTDGSLWSRIAGTDGYSLMEDIYVGDFFQMQGSSAAKTGNGRGIQCPDEDSSYATNSADCSWVTIAGIDTLRGNDDNISMNYHHLVMVPGGGTNYEKNNYFGRHRMNPAYSSSAGTGGSVGGYVGSEMFTNVLGSIVTEGSWESGATINQQLYAEFGTHLKTTRELLSNAMTSTLYNRFGNAGGAASNWAWTSCQAVLMSEIEVYGSTVWSSSGYDTGTANKQLPLFQFEKKAINNKLSYYWLKDIASSSHFCYCHNLGSANCSDAIYTNFFVRPRFVIA